MSTKQKNTKIKSLFLAVVVIVFCNLLIPKSVSAHILAIDGSIGAVLHIDPNDDPVAGQQSSFFFEFKDKQNKFNPADCLCTFYIYEDGKMIYTNPLTATTPNPTLDNIALFYTFPKKDVYRVSVAGYPSAKGNFQTFTLNYDIRVDRAVEQKSIGNTTSSFSNPNFFYSHTFYFIAAGFLAIIIIAALFWQRMNNLTKKRNDLK